MTFGEKVKTLRKEKGLNQTQLAQAVGVSLRTIRGWEIEGRYPKQHAIYQKLADILNCDLTYLMTENEAFITQAAEQFGSRGANQAQQIIAQTAAMFAGGGLSDEDKQHSWMRSRLFTWIQKSAQKSTHQKSISRKISALPKTFTHSLF